MVLHLLTLKESFVLSLNLLAPQNAFFPWKNYCRLNIVLCLSPQLPESLSFFFQCLIFHESYMFPLSWRWFLSKGERFMRVDINPNRTMIQIPLYSSCWQKCTFLSRNKMQTYPPLLGQSQFRLISNSKVVLLTEKPFSLFLVWLSLVSLAQIDSTWHVQPQGWQTHQQAGLSYVQFREWSEPPFTLTLKCTCQNLPNGCLLLSDLPVTLRGQSKVPSV